MMAQDYDFETKTFTTIVDGEERRFTAKEWREWWVPYEWRHGICMCLVPKHDNSRDLFRYCQTCHKLESWQLYRRCNGCKQHYFGRFIHHARIGSGGPEATMCFNCLTAKYGSHPDDVPPPIGPKEPRSLEEIMSDMGDDDDLNFTL